MQGKILKKILAAALVLTLVSGAVPIAPVADMFGGAVITANAEGTDTVYSGFTATAGTTGGTVNGKTIQVSGSEGYSKLVDGTKTTTSNKWCVVEYGGNFTVPIYVEFNSANPFVPTGYILTTGGDTQGTPGRNPKDWVIKAKNEGDADWTVLETVTDDDTLGAENNASYEFAFTNTNTNAYKYFRFEVNAIHSGGIFQLAEFEFKGRSADPTNLAHGSIDGLASKYYPGTSLDSLSYTVKDADGTTVDPANYDVTFTKDGTPVTDLSETGSYTMTVTGKGSYTGSCSATFNVDNIAVSSIEGLNASYTAGTPINSLTYTVKGKNGADVDPANYDVSFTKDGTAVNDLSEAGEYTMTVTGKNNYKGSCSASFDVKGTALTGSGTENDPYRIATANDWDNFVSNVSEGINYQNQFIALTDDINVTSTVGTEAKPFKGTFNGAYNGQSHTMTVNINDTTTQGTAPFREISDGAVIKNLTVTGTVTGSTHAAGLVGFSRGGTSEKPNTIENCVVDVDVSVPATSGNRHMGGVVGHGVTSCLKIKDTVFSGTMSNTDNYAGGLMGWCDGGCNLTIDNCLFNGSYTGTASNGFHPIAVCNRNATVTTNVQNCYYTAAPTLTSDSYIPVTTGEKVYSFAPFGYTTEQVSISGVSYNLYKVTAEPHSTLTINNADDWNSFAQSVSDGFAYDGVVIELKNNITVTDMVNGRFKGTLNGKGHKITFNYTQDTAEDAALFKAIDGATIKFLEVDGTITTSKKYTAAIAAHTYGTCNINSCISKVTIASTVDGDGTHGGFVAAAEGGSTLSINNCLFAGTMTGENTKCCGGFVGWNGGTVKISNSLMAGTFSIDPNDGNTFSRRSYSELKNSYYTASYGTAQGTAVGDKTNEQLVQALGIMWTISNNEVVPNFGILNNLENATVSGIDALYAYTGNVIDVNPVVTAVDETVLTEGVDYNAVLKKDGETAATVKDPGIYTYTFTPAEGSSYTGTLTSAEFTVGLIDLSSAEVTGINAEYKYTGSDISITPVITAADGKTLTNGTEYTTELKKDGTVVESVNDIGTYTYTFTGVEAQGYTGAKTVEFTVKLVKPTGIQQTAFGTDTAALSWNEHDDVTGYEFQYSKDSTFPEGSTTVTVTENTADLTGLDTDSKYYVRVRALNGGYSSEWSDTASFETTSKRWIGFGSSSTNNNLPFNNWYNYSVTEQLYTVQEIGEAGLITSVDLMKVANNDCVRKIDVYMVHTDNAYFSGTSDAVAVTEADKVFSGTVDFAYNEWTTIKFDTSFHYNGTQNVVLVIDDNTGDCDSSTGFKAFSINNTEALYFRSDYDNYSPTDLSNISWSSPASKNAVRFGIGNSHKISIDQNINSTTISAPNEETAGYKVTFSVNPVDGYYCTGASVNGGAVEVTRNADGTYSFTMPDEDAVISATFAQKYYVTVTWKNWDGTVLDTQQVGADEIPVYSGETPTKPDDDYYSYAFVGWDKEPTRIAEDEDKVYTAVFTNGYPLAVGTVFTIGDAVDFGDAYYTFDNWYTEPKIRQGKGLIIIETLEYDDGGYYVNGSYDDNLDADEQLYDLFVKYGTNNGNDISFIVTGGTGTEDDPFTFAVLINYTVTLPENMEFCAGSSSTAADGSTVQFKAKEGYTASNVKANGSDLTAENGIYSVTVTDNVDVTADIAEITNSFVSGANLALEGDIGVNIYLKASKTIAENTGAYVTVQGPNDAQPEKILLSDLTTFNNYGYKITRKLNAKQMGEDVTVRLYDSNDTEQTIYSTDMSTEYDSGYSYSPKKYFATVKDYGDDYAKLKALAAAMENYGEYARLYFGGTNTQVCDPTPIDDVTADTLDSYATAITGTQPDGVSYYGSSLLLNSKTSFRFYFTGTPVISSVTDDNGNNVAYTTGNASNMFYVEIADIAAKDLDKKFTVAVDGGYSVTAGALTYAYNTLKQYSENTDKKNLCSLVKSLYKYHTTAKTYLESLNS